ncbi:MAG: aldehyde dehydrogenase EutE [Lachnospiraceae bacterium]|nr:aldehyde dehydrogenase EutE [Lachnospiraceae bacterium]
MSVSEKMVQEVVQEVMAKMQIANAATEKHHGVFADMNDAIAAAKKAQQVVRNLSMDQREKIISIIRKKTHENAEIMARMGVNETGMGNVGDKILKHHLVADKVPGTEDIRTEAYSGDRGLTLVEMGPFGVIGAITPCTNPSETVLCNAMGMIAGGNTVVFNPHPQAIRTSIYAINMINEASLEAGGPDNVACTVENPTLDTSGIMMHHKDIPLIAATGGPGVVTAVLSSGKRGIGAGAGNPPALVDETADIRKAAQDIVNGCTFDNNLPCIAEKEIVAVDTVADELMHYMIAEQGCYLASKEEQERLIHTVITPKGLNRACVGRSAKVLLEMIGVTVEDNIRCIVFEGEKEHPLITTELMMPILGVVRAKDFEDAVEKAVWLEHGNRHSAHIHSKNVDHITTYAKAIDTAILVKNGPSYSALGFGGESICTFTIASRTGEGLTSAASFTKKRRCVMSDSLCIR